MGETTMNKQLGTKWFTFYTKVRPWLSCLASLAIIVDFFQYRDIYLSYWWMILYFVACLAQPVLAVIVFAKSYGDYEDFVQFVNGILIFETINWAYQQAVQQYMKNFNLVTALVIAIIILVAGYFLWYRLNIKYFKKRILREVPKTEPVSEPIVESKQHTNISNPVKRKFCSRCGGLIDNETKRCTGCGKQYFKGFKFTFSSFAIILLVILLAISTIYSLTLAQELNENAARIKELSELRASLVNKVDELTRKITNLEYEAQKNRELVDFVDDYVVFVEDDGTNQYHKFDCYKFKGNSFWVFNVENAIYRDYTPCPDCH